MKSPFYGYFHIQKDTNELEDVSLEEITKILLESIFLEQTSHREFNHKDKTHLLQITLYHVPMTFEKSTNMPFVNNIDIVAGKEPYEKIKQFDQEFMQEIAQKLGWKVFDEAMINLLIFFWLSTCLPKHAKITVPACAGR
jgi:hypothetical protein